MIASRVLLGLGTSSSDGPIVESTREEKRDEEEEAKEDRKDAISNEKRVLHSSHFHPRRCWRRREILLASRRILVRDRRRWSVAGII